MPMKNPPHPGDFIRTEIIEPAGLSVTAAAAALHVSRPALSSLLNGKADLSGDMALRIEKAFGVKMDTLMRMQSGLRHCPRPASGKSKSVCGDFTPRRGPPIEEKTRNAPLRTIMPSSGSCRVFVVVGPETRSDRLSVVVPLGMILPRCFKPANQADWRKACGKTISSSTGYSLALPMGLVLYLEEFATALAQDRYSIETVRRSLCAADHFGRWLLEQDLTLADADDRGIEQYRTTLGRCASGTWPHRHIRPESGRTISDPERLFLPNASKR